MRPLLFSIAYRMLSSVSDAEDLVQEAFLRYRRSRLDGTEIDSPRAYTSAVVTRFAIDESRSARRSARDLRGDVASRAAAHGSHLGPFFVGSDGRLINVISLEIADGVVQTIRSVIKPDKLQHLGPVADAYALIRPQLRTSRTARELREGGPSHTGSGVTSRTPNEEA